MNELSARKREMKRKTERGKKAKEKQLGSKIVDTFVSWLCVSFSSSLPFKI